MTEYAQDIAHWFQVNAGKLIWLAVVLAVVFAADRVISRVLRRVLDSSQIPSASIFVNLTRVTIWVTGTAMVLQPVFGINPTTLVTALGGRDCVVSLDPSQFEAALMNLVVNARDATPSAHCRP